jgi:hypothetical protein
MQSRFFFAFCSMHNENDFMYSVCLKIHHASLKSLNVALRSNRFALHRQNKQWDRLIYCLLREKNAIPPSPLTKAHIRLIRHSHRTLDFDGLVGSLKPVVDSLVSAGVILDDRWNVLGKWDVDQIFRPKKEGNLLEIYVSEVP